MAFRLWPSKRMIAYRSQDDSTAVACLPQLYQTEVLCRSHDQMGHQGIDKVQQKNYTGLTGQD